MDRKNFLSDLEFANYAYMKYRGIKLDLKEPKTYDEKVWYLKLHEHNELNRKCADKVAVREYVIECGLEQILNEIYGVFDSFEQIPFSKLPENMFIKCSHCSGGNVIYEKNKFDYKYYKNEFDFLMQRNYYWANREWNYKDIVPKIICERILRDQNNNLPLDYKFFCFGGIVKFLSLDIGVAQENGEHSESYWRNIYDCEFNLLPVKETRENYDGNLEKPENFENMIKYAEILSSPFKHCRVDLYNIDGKIYFGEITFYHGGGMNHFIPEEWEEKIGSWIDIKDMV